MQKFSKCVIAIDGFTNKDGILQKDKLITYTSNDNNQASVEKKVKECLVDGPKKDENILKFFLCCDKKASQIGFESPLIDPWPIDKNR